MTEDQPQRSLAGYKSKVTEQGDFENPNEGKPLLTEFDEYVFKLVHFPRVKTFPQIKDKKDGTRTTINVDKAICDFHDERYGNIVNAFFRVDALNFSEDESFQSAIIRFFRKIGTPLRENAVPDWENLFIVGMRFRGRVVIGKDAEKKPNGRYYLDIPTVRPLLPSDKHPDAVAASATASQSPDASPALANALFIAKGAKDIGEALAMLKAANASKDVTLAFFNANLGDAVKYPI